MPDQMLWTRRAVNRPSMVYVSSADQLRVVTYGSHDTNTLNVKARILDINGKLVYTNAVVPGGFFAVADVTYVPLIEGTLLSVVVSCNAADVHPGQQFAQVAIARGAGELSTPNSDNLVQGYTDTINVLAWPEGTIARSDDGAGYLYTVPSTNPPPGTDISHTMPSRLIWRILAANFTLGTDLGGADRVVRFTIQDVDGNVIVRAVAPTPQPASNTYRYNVTPGVPGQVLAGSVIGIGIPAGLRVRGGATFTTSVLNLAAGDALTKLVLLVDEWISL